MKRQTKAQKFLDLSDAVTCLRRGEPPKRLNSRRKDGSIPVKPVERSETPESEVLAGCLQYLRNRGVRADRLNNGTFFTNGRWHRYGIVGGGDIIAILPGGIHAEIETKAGQGGVLSVEQQRRRDRVTRAGGKYVVVCSVDELKRWYEDEANSIYLGQPGEPGEFESGL